MATPLIIGIAGGSGSGKTTIAEALVVAIKGVALIQHDAYYRHQPRLSLAERSRVNYDHPASLETDLLVSHLKHLRRGQSIERPAYDFTVHLRRDQVVVVAPARVMVLEGILVLADRDLRDLMDLKVFVDTDPDLRLARRLERDLNERGRTAGSVLTQYLETIRPMHDEFVEPSKSHADIIVSGIDPGIDPGTNPGGMRVGAVATIIELIRAQMQDVTPPEMR